MPVPMYQWTIAGKLAVLWGRAGRIVGHRHATWKPTGLDDPPASGMQYLGISHYLCRWTRYASGPYMPLLTIPYHMLLHHPSQLAPVCMLVTHYIYRAPPHGFTTNAAHPTGHPTAILLAP